jgi:hopene-associated glycosyltransferase HpnB
MALVLVGLAALAAWLFLMFGRHGFWLADQVLPPADKGMSDWPDVVCLIPARNEAALIGGTMTALHGQDYPGRLTLILIDDASDDHTVAEAQAISGARHLQIVSAPPLEPGWTGKLWALNAGVAAAPQAPLIWLCDADIRHSADSLRRLVAQQQRLGADLVSVMARLRSAAFWERWLIPPFIYFFQLIYPFPAVNRPANPIAGAAGGCVLITRAALERIGGIAALRDAVIDDCTLGRLVKQSGGRLWLGFSDGVASARAADGLWPLWAMVKRSAFAQLNYNWGLLAGALAGLALTFLAPPLLALGWAWHGNNWAAGLGGTAWALMVITYAPTLKRYGQGAWRGLLLPLITGLYGLMTLHSGLSHLLGRGSAWKGRRYGAKGQV